MVLTDKHCSMCSGGGNSDWKAGGKWYAVFSNEVMAK